MLLLVLAGGGLGLAAPQVPELPGPTDAVGQSGWVLADLNGDQNIDLATTRSGGQETNGYSHEIRIKLSGLQQTSFRFQSRGAIIELSARDVDGDHDGDLIVFEPLSTQPIGVWLNDGRGTFHQGRLADFEKLWSDAPGPALRASFEHIALFAISEDRIQPVAPVLTHGPPETIVAGLIRQIQPAPRLASISRYSPRGPPSHS